MAEKENCVMGEFVGKLLELLVVATATPSDWSAGPAASSGPTPSTDRSPP